MSLFDLLLFCNQDFGHNLMESLGWLFLSSVVLVFHVFADKVKEFFSLGPPRVFLPPYF